ncbi:L,D-transpeptidase [Streptomyces sp. NPDC005408]|uniref:L,D-transpeptidase n=1 Tax=Streptomyces sp. NPDC005408 TaxID=3155341 RepID=UPI0033A310B7
MSDHESDALGSALRVLAADAQTPPSLSGGQIRRRGAARGRRRRVVGATVGAVVLVAGVAFGVPRVMGTDDAVRRQVATDPPVPVPASARVTVNTAKKVLMFERGGQKPRSIPVTMRDDVTAGPAKVVYKDPKRRIPAVMFGKDGRYMIEASWVVELSRPSGEVLYIFADDASGAINRSVIGVPAADAGWVYDQFRVGDTVTVG